MLLLFVLNQVVITILVVGGGVVVIIIMTEGFFLAVGASGEERYCVGTFLDKYNKQHKKVFFSNLLFIISSPFIDFFF